MDEKVAQWSSIRLEVKKCKIQIIRAKICFGFLSTTKYWVSKKNAYCVPFFTILTKLKFLEQF